MSRVLADTRRAPAEPEAHRAGRRVRLLREAKGFSLRDLAERSGVSAPMLSQVERGDTSPTLAVAAKIAAGLDLTLSQLLRLDEGQDVVLSRKADRRSVKRNGHSFEELTPPLPGERVSVTAHSLKRGASTGEPGHAPIHAPGSRETAVVQFGKLVLTLAGRQYELAKDDSVTFDADLPHRFHNPGPAESRFLAIVTAGLRRT